MMKTSKINDNNKKVSLSLSVELYHKLKARAEADCRSLPSYIRLILECHVLYLEQHQDAPQDWWRNQL